MTDTLSCPSDQETALESIDKPTRLLPADSMYEWKPYVILNLHSIIDFVGFKLLQK